MIYKGESLSQLRFPLGGIGTGCISIQGNGRLVDFEIFGRPSKNSLNGYTGFAVKAERDGRVLDARVLSADEPPHYMGAKHRGDTRLHTGYGFGPVTYELCGLPHFESCEFDARFPAAELRFSSADFPGRVTLRALNPFIPLNEADSSIPAAMFEIEFENTTSEPIEYSACLFFGSPYQPEVSRHVGGAGSVTIDGMGDGNRSRRGEITIATDCPDSAIQHYWYRGGWQDEIEMFWNEFTAPGLLRDRNYEPSDAPNLNKRDTACLMARAVDGGKLRFVATWRVPEIYNFWTPEAGEPTYWTHHYATVFSSSGEAARYVLENWARLEGETLMFTDALHGSSLPAAVLDAVTSNLSVLKTPTCLRLSDGTFYGFEGCLEDEGSCEGSCSHVWNYQYALPFLFPALERSMREAEYKYNQRDDGRVSFRLMLPLGRERLDFRACADGQLGGVIKTFREWRHSGDDDWLRRLWPSVKKSLEYAWSDTNEDRWDIDQTGVLHGRQHHTLDMELFGPNAWLTGFYLAALTCGAEMAKAMGEHASAEMYLRLAEAGKRWSEDALWNGEYYQQRVDLADDQLLIDDEARHDYWNAEAGELKYQIAGGCCIDQVTAGWHARLVGLPEVFDEARTRAALESLYRYNFKSMRGVVNLWRNYAVNDERGLIICSWPHGSKPSIPLTYASECMTGFEYQAACHMIQCGLVDEGLEVVSAIRDRFDGVKRNPFNEFECGSNYARSMASYSLLIGLSGFSWDARRGAIGFEPVNGAIDCFFSTHSGWGTAGIGSDGIRLTLLYGALELREVVVPERLTATEVRHAGQAVAFEQHGNRLTFAARNLKAGEVLEVFTWG